MKTNIKESELRPIVEKAVKRALLDEAKSFKDKKPWEKDYVKANRKGSRDADLENDNGFKANTKVHKSPKDYSRKGKNNKPWEEELDEAVNIFTGEEYEPSTPSSFSPEDHARFKERYPEWDEEQDPDEFEWERTMGSRRDPYNNPYVEPRSTSAVGYDDEFDRYPYLESVVRKLVDKAINEDVSDRGYAGWSGEPAPVPEKEWFFDSQLAQEMESGKHGGFAKALFHAFLEASPGNRQKLASVFPKFFEKYKYF